MTHVDESGGFKQRAHCGAVRELFDGIAEIIVSGLIPRQQRSQPRQDIV